MSKTKRLPGRNLVLSPVVAGLLCLLFSPVFSQEQRYRFEYFSVEHGLPSGQILCMLQDHTSFLWFGTMNGLARYDGYHFKVFRPVPGDSTSISDATAGCLLEDRDGALWVGTNRGLNRYDPNTGAFKRYFHREGDETSLPGNYIGNLSQDSGGRIWVSTTGGIAFLDLKTDRFTPIKYISGREERDWRTLRAGTVVTDRSGKLWTWSDLGIVHLDPDHQAALIFHPDQFSGIPDVPFESWSRDLPNLLWYFPEDQPYAWDPHRQQFARVVFSGDEFSTLRLIFWLEPDLWVGFYANGLFFYTPQTNQLTRLPYSSGEGMEDAAIHFAFADRFDNIWLGPSNGLYPLHRRAMRFPFYQQFAGRHLVKNYIYRTHEDRRGGWWFSSYDKRLYHAEKLGAPACQVFFQPGKQTDIRIGTFHSDSEGRLWIASNDYGSDRKHGIFVCSPPDARPRRLALGDTLDHCSIHFIEEDRADKRFLWLGTEKGLCKLDKHSHTRTWYYPKQSDPALVSNNIYHALQTDDRIWLQLDDYFTSRLGYFDKTAGRFAVLDLSARLPGRRADMLIRGFAQTPDGSIWIASAQGLGKLDPKTLDFKLLTASDGQAETELMGIACDAAGCLWLKGLTSVTRYEPRTGAFRIYPVSADMGEMNTVGATVCRDGRVLLHGNNGIYGFQPDSIWHDTTPPKVVLIDFKVLDRSFDLGRAPDRTDTIRLPYASARILSFEFAALHFLEPKHIRYRYRLLGFQDNWFDLSTDRKATFTNLPPGSYLFQVQACNSDGVCSGPAQTLSVHLQVLPPWWAAWWAILLYVLSGARLLQLVFRFRLRQKLVRAEARRLLELDRFKTRFFTNITHEFRTPLTLILGPVTSALNKVRALQPGELRPVKRNAERLLQLIDQILQLSKLEAGMLQPALSRADLVPFLRYLVESFHIYAESRSIELKFETAVETLVLDFDKEKWQTIVANLLSNALKFTPEHSGGRVSLRLEYGERLRLTVRDNGPGIPAGKLPFLFDCFYRAGDVETDQTGGTGIGLALTKELVELLGGRIAVESTLGAGSAFTVEFAAPERYLDLGNSVLDIGYFKLSINQHGISNAQMLGPKLRILLVEDHPDTARYIASCLGPAAETALATDGRRGLELAQETIPDLVISDVILPAMDGYALCRTLKNDERTSHIPVILVTAKADQSSRLQGLEQGADAYLFKPFDEEELLVRVRKLLELRRHLQAYYRNLFAGQATPAAPAGAQLENIFVQKLCAALDQNLDDHRFQVSALARAVGMQQPQLFRKLRALTGQAPNAFIRNYRLGRARAMLAETGLSISEIAYACGFSAPAHLTHAFTRAFGMSPSGYRGSFLK
ncbi:MAG: response regulator [Saprospirales bacterium]|nr:response regulator [Saprospirales bacterium]